MIIKTWQFIVYTIIIIIIHIFLKIITNETSEDKYHREVHKDIDNLDDAPIIKFKFKNKQDYHKIKKNIRTGGIFSKHYQSIKKFKPNFKLCDQEVLSNKSEILKFNFKDKKKYFTIIFNHFYLGADSFIHLKSDVLLQDYINFPSSNYKSCILLPKFMYDYHKFLKSPNFESLPKLKKVRRYSELSFFPRNDYDSFNKRSFILYHVIKKLYNCLQLRRPMRVMLPVPFKRFNKINNNVGAIFILFNGHESLEDFNKIFNEKKYMALASNFLLISKINTLFSDNGSLRKQIDVVITALYSNDYGMDYSLNWTTKIMPLESVYTAVYSRITESGIHTNITYTVATKNFKKCKQIKKYKLN